MYLFKSCLLQVVEVRILPSFNRQIKIYYISFFNRIEEASLLCCQLLKRLCLEPDTCSSLICTDDLFEILVKPIKQFLNSKKMFNDNLRSNTNTVAERGLIRLADIFAAIASTDAGYQYLIRTPSTPSSGSPASLIFAYVKRILSQYTINRTNSIIPDLSLTTSYSSIPTKLLSEFIYVCRLIYSRTSGLIAMKRTQLHKTLAETFRIEVKFERKTRKDR